MEQKIMTVGVIGAGAISDIYIENMKNMFGALEVKSVCAKHLERAEAKAAQHQLQACTLEEMLGDAEIEMVVVLTPVDTHFEIIKAALEAGKHVYTEKTITETTVQAAELLKLADEKGLYLGSAPDTFLGTAFQSVRKAIDEGVIGEIHSFSMAINRCNDVLTTMFPFLRLPGAGVLRDYQVYYLTALISLLGPAKKVGAFVRTPYTKRVGRIPGTADFGKEYETPNESVVAAMLELESGVVGTIHQNHETMCHDRADFVIYGTKGMLCLGDPNQFGQPAKLLRTDSFDAPTPEVIETAGAYAENSRGLGPAEMADSIWKGVNNRASKELAYHVLDILECMEKSSESGMLVEISSTCERPEAFYIKL